MANYTDDFDRELEEGDVIYVATKWGCQLGIIYAFGAHPKYLTVRSNWDGRDIKDLYWKHNVTRFNRGVLKIDQDYLARILKPETARHYFLLIERIKTGNFNE